MLAGVRTPHTDSPPPNKTKSATTTNSTTETTITIITKFTAATVLLLLLEVMNTLQPRSLALECRAGGAWRDSRGRWCLAYSEVKEGRESIGTSKTDYLYFRLTSI